VRQRRLARILRGLREDAGLSIEQVAEKLELSPSTISRMETAQVGIRINDLRPLLDIYQVTGMRRDELLQLARERRQQVWWQEYKDLPTAAVASLETESAYIKQFSVQVIPGLLQTEPYAREILRAIHFQPRPHEIERRLELRMARQALLAAEDPPQYWVILDESVLHRVIGSHQIMQAQLQRLIGAAAMHNVTLQILPFSAGAHPGMDGEFTILSYRDQADPDVVFLEATGGDAYIENAVVTRRYNLMFDHLRAAALHPAESVRTLGDVEQHLSKREE
jgi:transcriptional regulator with XRE-family HTH domain